MIILNIKQLKNSEMTSFIKLYLKLGKKSPSLVLLSAETWIRSKTEDGKEMEDYDGNSRWSYHINIKMHLMSLQLYIQMCYEDMKAECKLKNYSMKK